MSSRLFVLALGLAVVSCASTSNQTAYSYNSFNLERAIKNSQAVIDRVRAENPTLDADNKEQERELFGHGIDSFQELVADAQTMLDAGTAASTWTTTAMVVRSSPLEKFPTTLFTKSERQC